MSTGLILLAIILVVVFLAILEKHLERVSRVGGDLAEKIKDRIVVRTLAVIITVIIVAILLGYTTLDLKEELIMTFIGAFAIELSTILQNEMEIRDLL